MTKYNKLFVEKKTSGPVIVEDSSKYFTLSCGSVYEHGELENTFVGNLNGRTLEQFLHDKEMRELHCSGDVDQWGESV